MQAEQEERRQFRGPRVLPFVGIPSFLRVPICTDLDQLDADIAVLGAPTDEESPFLPGARFGPRALPEHSTRFGASGYFDPQSEKMFLDHELSNQRLVDVGDAMVLPTNAEDTFHNITALTLRVLDRGALPVVLGGDHAISYPVVRAFSEPLHVMHFDAHLDYAPFLHGYEYTNGHQPSRIIFVGQRMLKQRQGTVNICCAETVQEIGTHDGLFLLELPEGAGLEIDPPWRYRWSPASPTYRTGSTSPMLPPTPSYQHPPRRLLSAS